MRHRKFPQICALLLVCALAASCSFAGASTPTPAASTPALMPSPSPTPSPTPTPTPTPTPVPTPTPDPLDAIFAGEGEEIVVYQKGGVVIDPYKKGAPIPDYWLYNSHDLRVEIKHVLDKKNRFSYFVADIRMRNGVREIAGFGKKKAPGHSRTKPNVTARLYSAVFAQNGDYLVYKEKELKGILIRDGKVYYQGKKEDTLAFFPDMSLKAYSPGEITARELLDLNVLNTWSFGPVMIKDGKLVEKMKNVRGINKGRNPRSGIGMIEPGHLVSIVVEGFIPRSKGMTMSEFAQLFLDQGCSVAMNLDGGASSAFVFMGNICNTILDDDDTYGGPRPQVDMIIFGQSGLCPGINDPVYNNGVVKVK